MKLWETSRRIQCPTMTTHQPHPETPPPGTLHQFTSQKSCHVELGNKSSRLAPSPGGQVPSPDADCVASTFSFSRWLAK